MNQKGYLDPMAETKVENFIGINTKSFFDLKFVMHADKAEKLKIDYMKL